MYLKKEEIQILYRKYRSLGLSNEEANYRLEEFKNYIKNLLKVMEKEKKSEDEINQRFKSEFWEMCQKLEV